MSVAIVTGSAGLVGSEASEFLHEKGLDVVGIDNDMRRYFFGAAASTASKAEEVTRHLARYTHEPLDIRDRLAIDGLFKRYGGEIELVVHAAAQPSHDWAAREPFTDFSINAEGTLVLLEATRQFCPEASFIFTSTNKVYGDTPNALPLIEQETRWELEASHPYAEHGIDESMSLDRSTHSLFGASKVAADILVQEYGRYFSMNTVSFRAGCLTGPAHAGAELHGFLAYLVRCAVTGTPYTIFGYKGKQVRDNIHSADLVNAFWHYHRAPRPAEVYNIGGSHHSSCSVLEAIEIVEALSGRKLKYAIADRHRTGDHVWWISDVRRFQRHYPAWCYRYDLRTTVQQIVDAVNERQGA